VHATIGRNSPMPCGRNTFGREDRHGPVAGRAVPQTQPAYFGGGTHASTVQPTLQQAVACHGPHLSSFAESGEQPPAADAMASPFRAPGESFPPSDDHRE